MVKQRKSISSIVASFLSGMLIGKITYIPDSINDNNFLEVEIKYYATETEWVDAPNIGELGEAIILKFTGLRANITYAILREGRIFAEWIEEKDYGTRHEWMPVIREYYVILCRTSDIKIIWSNRENTTYIPLIRVRFKGTFTEIIE